MLQLIRNLTLAASLLLPALAGAQQELRSGLKGASVPVPITATSIDANHTALDVNVTVGDRTSKTVCPSITLTTITETTLCAAGGVGVFLDLTHLSCTNTSATLVRADIRDATAGTVKKSMALAASGGGFEMNLPSMWPQAASNNNWTVQLSGAVTDVRCQAIAMINR